MISIIICSRATEISPRLKANIDNTIGVEYELIAIDNSGGHYSIFEAYNLGIKQSKYPFLCFMHDDILYHTDSWGVNVVNHFKDEQTGAIGIAGSPYVAQMLGSWWGSGIGNMYILPEGKPVTEAIVNSTGQSAVKNEVIVLDGVWMCVRKSLFDKIHFDEEHYTGYHFYDIDICMLVYQSGYKLFSIFDVLITHFSKGNMNANWYENAMAFQKKWRTVLPVSCITLAYHEQCKAEHKTLTEFINVLLANEMHPRKVYKLAVVQLLKTPSVFFYYKTPAYLMRYLFKLLSNKRSG